MSDNHSDRRLNRRDVIKHAAAGTGMATLLGASTATASADQNNGQGPKSVRRAVAAYEALQEHFYKEDDELYLEQYPHQGGNEYSYVWPFTQAMAGTIDLFGIQKGDLGERYEDDVQTRLSGLEKYWNPEKDPSGYDSYVRPPYGDGGDFFYDDNIWIGLELVQLYRMTGNEEALARARELFELIVYGWADDESLPRPGGVYWTQADWNDDRNTVSNAPAAELGLHLYQLTDDEERQSYYLEWATKMYDWVNEHLRAPNGLYWDHVNPDGSITKWIFTYNQGTMIGANVLFYEITGDESYLQEAEAIADAALAYFQEEGRLYEEDVDFAAIFFKNLLLLANVNHDPTYRKAMESYADWLWNELRDPETNLLRREDADATHLLRQSAFVQINASLAWLPRDYDDLA